MSPEFPVSPAKQEEVRARLARLGVSEDDLEETFTRSSGPGGQNVNKVATCVVLVHRPSGLAVRCQESRSQALNRFLARRRLVGELEARARGEAGAARARAWKIRKQKARRSRRAKERMLADKRRQAEKKDTRRPIHEDIGQ